MAAESFAQSGGAGDQPRGVFPGPRGCGGGGRNFSAKAETVPGKPGQEGLGQQPGEPVFSQYVSPLDGRGDRAVQG